MIINDTRAKSNKVIFRELSIGQVYEDAVGLICIKTYNEDTQHNCVTFINGKWNASIEDTMEEVTPLNTTLTIER